jgi:FkbM family methyltransferase
MLGLPITFLHPDWDVLAPAGPVHAPHVILDVGAHHGWFFHCWLDWCPQAEVHAFEPTAESFAQMQALYGHDRRAHLVPQAVGSQPGELKLHILSDSQVSNSLLKPNSDSWRDIHYTTGAISERTVPVTTLDTYCSSQAIGSVHLLKIDVQGYELEVLRGAVQTLPRVSYVFVEAGIKPLYEGAPSFAEICGFMGEHGFHLVHMRAWHRGNRVLVEADLLFRRNDLAPPVDDSRDRTYVALR